MIDHENYNDEYLIIKANDISYKINDHFDPKIKIKHSTLYDNKSLNVKIPMIGSMPKSDAF